jgi:hypothetical protein
MMMAAMRTPTLWQKSPMTWMIAARKLMLRCWIALGAVGEQLL